jgi:hypothetical protein
MALVAGVRWSLPGEDAGSVISVDMGATEDAARGGERVPAAQPLFRQA